LRFAFLGSGSEGNAALIQKGATRLLYDCGYSCRELNQRLSTHGLSVDELSGIVITHEHRDHIAGLISVIKQCQLPVWLTAGTFSTLKRHQDLLSEVHLIDPDENFMAGEIEVQAFPVPHDAREPCQYIFSDGKQRIGFLTDTGTITPHIIDVLDGCDALVLECNHDRELLSSGDYPEWLKQRIASRLGHLDNDTAAELLSRLDTSRIKYLVAAHLSQKNNSEAHVRRTIEPIFPCESDRFHIAPQHRPMPWLEL
jgi:phosphoribosyl 1,2-cyclic phosphodiesterase